MANPRVVVDFIANTAKLQSAASDVSSSGGKMKKTFAGVGKAIGTGLAVGAVVSFGKASVTAAQESAVATARLDNIFRSMGDATGTASKEAQAYAGSLSKQIGVEDEVIMQGQALLATFKNVSNETARAAGIFNQATAAAADLAAAGFGSIESNSKMLGKALNDPIKGLTALTRAGVTFTGAQKEQIKTLVATGDILGAQKIIMKEVETQVGGTAAATATESQKMAVAFGEVQESVGKALLPILNELAPMLAQVAGFIADNTSVIAPLIAILAGLAATIKIVTVAQVALNLAMSANPIGLVVIALAALAAGLFVAYQKSQTFRDIVNAVGAALKTAFLAAVNAGRAAIDIFRAAVTAITNVFQAHRTLLIAVAAVMAGPLVAGFVAVRFAIKNADTALDALKTAFNTARSAAQAIASYLKGAFESAVNAARGALSGLRSVAEGLAGPFNSAASAVRGLIDAIKSIPSRIHLPSIPSLPNPFRAAMPTVATAGPTMRAGGRSLAGGSRLVSAPVNVRVFIGSTELRGMVRTEVSDATTGLARTLLAGARG